ncbi:hypothetical protein FWC63_01935 [Candidatus Saccharibacteria bacterium]|nr:hypothetical protein [Candidatus Saccharibacteria bacterium]
MRRKLQLASATVAATALSILIAATPLMVLANNDPTEDMAVNCADLPLVEGTNICLPNAAERIFLSPGQEVSRSITVRNGGSVTYSLEVEPAFFLPSAEAGDRFSQDGVFTEMRSWISIERNEFRNIGPGETITINYTINTPADAPGGSQFAGINIRTIEDNADAVVARKQLQFRIFARVSGDTIERGEVVAFDIPQWVRGGDLDTSLTVRNAGNTDFMSANTLVVRSLFGREVYRSASTPDNNVFLFPGSDSSTIRLTFAEPRFGLYYVTQQTVLAGGAPIENTRLVLVAPSWMVATFFVGLCAALVLISIAVVTRIQKSRRFVAE